MKKSILILPIILLFFSVSFPIEAQISNNYIQHSVTSDGINYVVYEVDTTIPENQVQANTITVVREFHYTGIVQPPAEQIYKENINGTIYGGTLILYSVLHENNLTIATYQGTLVAIN